MIKIPPPKPLKKSKGIHIRVTPMQKAYLKKCAHMRGTNLSALMLIATYEFLNPKEVIRHETGIIRIDRTPKGNKNDAVEIEKLHEVIKELKEGEVKLTSPPKGTIRHVYNIMTKKIVVK